MRSRILFITGTDTGVGKTVLTALLTCCVRDHGLTVAALKPICSGGRGDARVLHSLLDGALTMDEVNPWHFHAPLAPLLAARQEHRHLKAADVIAHVRRMQRDAGIVLVEGAGGLLSPLGEDFNARDLIIALRAVPLVVCPNRLGAINQALLAIDALPARAAREAHVMLVAPRRKDAASRTNPRLLAEFLGSERVQLIPWLGASASWNGIRKNRRARRAVEVVARRVIHISNALIFPGP